jgi:hypothetical protein
VALIVARWKKTTTARRKRQYIVSGYKDSACLFDDAVVAKVRSLKIAHVVWLTLRTDAASYHDRQQRANADVYRPDDRVLFEKAAEHGGYLQIVDWATYWADHAGWFSSDVVHLTAYGSPG